MGSASRMIGCWAVALSLVLIVNAPAAPADVTTERSSSILVFPKVLFDSTGTLTGTPLDTFIQISNTSNSMVFAHCFYVNAAPLDPSRPAGPTNLPRWQEVDFEIFLTKQQPTHWIVSGGRRDDPSDNKGCSVDCSSAGFDPGRVPPVGDDPFVGELKCVEVDSSGAPINGNHLKGEATIVTTDAHVEVSKYNALGILGLNTDLNSNNSDNILCLGGGASERCPMGAEYNGCPQTVIVNHFAENASDPVIDHLATDPQQVSSVSTELTLVPCTQDFENQAPSSVVVQFLVTNEFELPFSTSTTVTCWGNFRLSEIGSVGRVLEIGTLGTRFAQARLTAAGDEQPGFIGVAEEFHTKTTMASGSLTSRAAVNLHGEGVRPRNDVITLPGAF